MGKKAILFLLVLMFFIACGGRGSSVNNPLAGNDPLAIEMVFVKGGTFMMGCTLEQGDDCRDWEKPAHRVTLSDFYIGKYEVTQKQWQEIMGTTVKQQQDEDNWEAEDWPLYGEGDDYPMYYVNWREAQEFIKRLNRKTGKKYRLPTEAEWEYAARGGNQSRGYKYSGSDDIDEVAWYGGNSGRVTHPVGTKKANELGIHDMTGNVLEWVSDRRGNYSGAAQYNPKGPLRGSSRVSRGGDWNYGAFMARLSYRALFSPGLRVKYQGFRLAHSSR